MRPRLPTRRILYLRPFRPPNSPRPFTHNTICLSRPQLPFLASSARRPTARFLSTETKQRFKRDLILAGKYNVYFWSTAFLLAVVAFGVQEEVLDRKYPAPRDWTWWSRKDYRTTKWKEAQDKDGAVVDWVKVAAWYQGLVERLEDPTLDGAGLDEQGDGGILVAGLGKTGFDVSQKSENWTRGYHEALMGAARGAEQLDAFVVDRTRRVVFPADMVIGPSNPTPRRIRPGMPPAPMEENCEPASLPPETWYMRILTTKGFTDKQKLDAALAYALWLDYKKTPDAASEMYKWALDIATSSSHTSKPIVDPTTSIINTDAGLPSANVLAATTAIAIHHATNNNISAALPIFLSVLRARRSLPEAPPSMYSTLHEEEEPKGILGTIGNFAKTAMKPPTFPAPPEDGTSPPSKTPKEICEEAAIMNYIGEILYVSKSSKRSQEDGLAWTREAVDIAEEQLRNKRAGKEGRETCKQCLSVGLENWAQMVSQLSELEKEAKKEKKTGWLGFGGEEQKDVVGRWESEEQVVKERIRRARDVLDSGNSAPPSSSYLQM